MKKIAILGSTGSIGRQTLSVLREQGGYSVIAMSCGHNTALLEKQIREFSPQFVSVADEKAKKDLLERLSDRPIEVLTGVEGLEAVATAEESQIVVNAVVGMLGILPTIAAIEAGKDIAFANKETLVCAGSIIMPLVKKKGVALLPVDSEHSAIFQSMQGYEGNPIKKILLTASGGPFRGWKKEALADVTVEQALAHPNWAMGKKITIDSATMVNKGLEIIEAAYLFGVDIDRIEVVVHPESIIHSAVEYEDGAVIAQMGVPDMRLPIAYALYYPERKALSGDRLDLFSRGQLTFEKPDREVFRGLSLAVESFKKGGTAPTIFNAANEQAVAFFLDRKITFLEIVEMIEEAMIKTPIKTNPTVEDILEAEREARDWVNKRLRSNT